MALSDEIKNVMVGFQKGQLIGVDIGLSAVKMCLLEPGRKGSYKIAGFVHKPLSEAAIIEDEIQKPDEVIDCLIEGYSELGTKNVICNVGLDGPNTVTKRLQVPDGVKEEVEDNILWEAEQYIPFGTDDSELDYAILGTIEEDDVKDCIVAACKSDLVHGLTEILEAANLFTKVVDLKVFALNNILEAAYADRIEELSSEGTIFLDFGAQSIKIIVYRGGGPVLTKELPLGGVLITEEIQRQMGLSYEEAEDLKTSGNLPEEVLTIIESQLEAQMEEIKKVLNFYIAAGSSEQVNHCFVTGGSSLLPGLIDMLEDVIGVDIEVFDPFKFISYDKKIDKDILHKVASSGAVALGLGMRKV